MGYDFVAKAMHRAGLVALHRQRPHLPILYLDGEDGEATTSFIKQWGIPGRLLIPVNHDPSVIALIRTQHPRVKGCVGDINIILREMEDDTLSAVWLDYTCRFTEHVHVDVFRDALRVAPFVSITFSTRAIDKGVLANDIVSKIRNIGRMVENITPYRGRSDIQNMIKFTIARKDCTSDEGENEDGEETIDPNEMLAPNDKVFVMYRGVDLTAIVLDTNDHENRVLVRFDYDAEQKWVDADKVTKNAGEIDMTPFMGKEIAPPLKIFKNGTKGYEMTKRNKRNMFFTIGKRHRGTARYTIHAVRKDGKIERMPEHWTVSPEEAVCWRRLAT
jgi:hypothetical protein